MPRKVMDSIVQAEFEENKPHGDLDAVNDQILLQVQEGSFEDRAFGCIIGGFIGDSCGSFHEFESEIIKDMSKCMEMPGGGCFKVGPGQITDDGELALCSVQALVEGNGKLSGSLYAKWYLAWYQSNPFDMGITT